jgi:hypothetical protein
MLFDIVSRFLLVFESKDANSIEKKQGEREQQKRTTCATAA